MHSRSIKDSPVKPNKISAKKQELGRDIAPAAVCLLKWPDLLQVFQTDPCRGRCSLISEISQAGLVLHFTAHLQNLRAYPRGE